MGINSSFGIDMTKNEDREFQLEMLRVQMDYQGVMTVLTSILAMLISWLVALYVLYYSNVLPAEIKAVFFGAIVFLTASFIFGLVVAVLFVTLLFPRDINKLRKTFIRPDEAETDEIELLQRILEEVKKLSESGDIET